MMIAECAVKMVLAVFTLFSGVHFGLLCIDDGFCGRHLKVMLGIFVISVAIVAFIGMILWALRGVMCNG